VSEFERTGWRDEWISKRHRAWGHDCPATDIDFLMNEYCFLKPVAGIDYKHFQAWCPTEETANVKATRALFDGYKDGPLPFLIVRYWPDICAFQVFPMNESAKQHFQYGETLTEQQYVKRLYRIRGLSLVKSINENLHDVLPPSEDLKGGS
jgi:hypothetical protein